MIDRALSMLVALSLAFLIWLYARSRDLEALDNVPVPVRLALAPGQADRFGLQVTGPCQVFASFVGPTVRVREARALLQRGELVAELTVSVPDHRLGDSSYCDVVRVEPQDLRLPPGVTTVLAEGRNRVTVTVHRLVERRMPVRLDYAGEHGVRKATAEPAFVLVRGPEELLDRARAIPTQPCGLPPRPDGSDEVEVGPVPLVREIEGQPVKVVPEAVFGRLTFEPRQQTYEVSVPVRFLCPPNFGLRPRFVGEDGAGRVTARVVGPARDEPPRVTAFVDLTRAVWPAGVNREAVQIQCPTEYQPAAGPPPAVVFELVPTEPAPGR